MADISHIASEVTKEIANVSKDALKPEQTATSDVLKEESVENKFDAQNKAQSDGSFEDLREQKPESNNYDMNSSKLEKSFNDEINYPNITRDSPTTEKLKEQSIYSDNTTNYIRSNEEYNLYNDIGLKEKEVNGKTILQRSDIDPNLKDAFGKTNNERMIQGKAPIGNDGKAVELHHVGQKQDSPLAELTYTEHKQNSHILHDNDPSEVNHGNIWAKEKSEIWKERSKDF